MGERKIGREIGVEEREPQRGRRRDRDETKIEISTCKNKEYKKAKSFIWMF